MTVNYDPDRRFNQVKMSDNYGKVPGTASGCATCGFAGTVGGCPMMRPTCPRYIAPPHPDQLHYEELKRQLRESGLPFNLHMYAESRASACLNMVAHGGFHICDFPTTVTWPELQACWRGYIHGQRQASEATRREIREGIANLLGVNLPSED